MSVCIDLCVFCPVCVCVCTLCVCASVDTLPFRNSVLKVHALQSMCDSYHTVIPNQTPAITPHYSLKHCCHAFILSMYGRAFIFAFVSTRRSMDCISTLTHNSTQYTHSAAWMWNNTPFTIVFPHPKCLCRAELFCNHAAHS